LDAEKAVLDEMVKPFAELIRALQPSAVMVSHIVVPARGGERNASLSRPVIQGWLREELGFRGFVLGDDFSMKAVSSRGLSPEAAAVEALKAGVDMIMAWPSGLSRLHRAILDALAEGQLSRERLREAAGRIIAEKIRRGLIPDEAGS
jgi:beta-N-acetylhexosaminidase